MDALHVSVLLHECIDNLNIRPDGIYVDGTLGMGGHSEQIAARLTTGKLIGIDRDETAIERAGARLAPFVQRRIVERQSYQHIGAYAPIGHRTVHIVYQITIIVQEGMYKRLCRLIGDSVPLLDFRCHLFVFGKECGDKPQSVIP